MKKLSFVAALLCASVAMFAQATAPEAAPTAPTYPANQVKAVYSATYNADCNFGEWGSGTVYTQEEVGKKYVTTQLGYFGLCFDGEGQHLNCSQMEALHLDVWIAKDTTIRVVPIWGQPEQGKVVNLTGGQWNSVDIALADYDQAPSWADIYQIKIDEARNITFWLNNVYFYTTVAPEADTIAPTDFSAELVETSFFSARIKAKAKDNSGSVKFSVINGELVVASAAGESDADVYINVKNLGPDTEYSLSVIASDDSGNEAEPIVVAVHTLAPPDPANAPDFTNKENVVAVFCDALENNPAIAIGSWGQKTEVIEGELAEGDHVYFCSNMNYLGWEFTPHLNASAATFVHLDFYTATMDSVNLTPISPGHEGSYTVRLTKEQWNYVDVPLNAFDGKSIDWADIFQFKFMDAAPDGKDLFIDNVYFYSEVEQGIDAVEDGVKARKVVENGQLFIIKNGVRYNALGNEIK